MGKATQKQREQQQTALNPELDLTWLSFKISLNLNLS